MKFKIGDKRHVLNIGPGYRLMSYKIHIVGIVEGMIVYRWYGRRKQYWHYEIKHPASLEIEINNCKEMLERKGA